MINQTVLAVVTHTGFNSKKGELIRCLLFPEQINFKFYEDAKKFVFLLALLSTIGNQIISQQHQIYSWPTYIYS